jgi:hypothetical protein
MPDAATARVATAGPIALLAAMVGMALAVAFSNLAQWPVYVVLVVVPAALCFWLIPASSVAARVGLAGASVIVSLAVAAGVALLLLPLFEVAGVGPSGTGVYTLLYGPTVVVLLASVTVRIRSGSPLFGAWLAWWIPAAAGTIWGEPLTYALTDLAGADAIAGSLSVLAAPTVGMAAWLGVVVVRAVRERLIEGARNKRIDADRPAV